MFPNITIVAFNLRMLKEIKLFTCISQSTWHLRQDSNWWAFKIIELLSLPYQSMHVKKKNWIVDNTFSHMHLTTQIDELSKLLNYLPYIFNLLILKETKLLSIHFLTFDSSNWWVFKMFELSKFLIIHLFTCIWQLKLMSFQKIWPYIYSHAYASWNWWVFKNFDHIFIHMHLITQIDELSKKWLMFWPHEVPLNSLPNHFSIYKLILGFNSNWLIIHFKCSLTSKYG